MLFDSVKSLWIIIIFNNINDALYYEHTNTLNNYII